MAYAARWRRVRVAIPLVLLITILMRLVWMQIRGYPIVQDARALIAIERLVKDEAAGCAYERAQPIESMQLLSGGVASVRAARVWLSSPGDAVAAALACRHEVLADRYAVRLNQILLAATVLMAVMMTRFLTSSWTVSLVVGGMLMSRGRLLADLGRVSADWPVVLSFTAWATCIAHYLRTGAWASFCGAAAAVAVGSLFERSLAPLALAMPVVLGIGYAYRRQLARPVIQRLREVNRHLRVMYRQPRASAESIAADQKPVLGAEEVESFFGRLSGSIRWMLGLEFPPPEATGHMPSYARGSLFRTLGVPFLLWTYHKQRWLRLSLAWLGVFALVIAASAVAYAWMLDPGVDLDAAFAEVRLTADALPRHFADLWMLIALDRVDLHLAASCLVILACALQSPAAGLPGFLEATWMVIAATALMAAAAFGFDLVDAQLVALLPIENRRLLSELAFGPRPFVVWVEPTLLSLGAAGVYNLMKVFDTRVAQKS